MPKIMFSFRFIVDSHFFEEVMKNDSSVFLSMMYISSCSKRFKRRHNLMSEKTRNKIIEDNPTYSEEYIKSSLNKVNEPSEIEEIDDEILRNIHYAVYYASELENSDDNITKICILTSDAKKEEYIKNTHLKDVKGVYVRSGNEAKTILDDFKNQCWKK